MHPLLLEGTWSAFELDLAELFDASAEPVTYRDVISFPAVRQDLAFVVDEDAAAGDLVAAAQEAAGPELREIRVFDVYQGEPIPPGKKSIAFSVAFQSRNGPWPTRTRPGCARRSSTRSAGASARRFAPSRLVRSGLRASRIAPPRELSLPAGYGARHR